MDMKPKVITSWLHFESLTPTSFVDQILKPTKVSGTLAGEFVPLRKGIQTSNEFALPAKHSDRIPTVKLMLFIERNFPLKIREGTPVFNGIFHFRARSFQEGKPIAWGALPKFRTNLGYCLGVPYFDKAVSWDFTLH
jgi:hypothetical protein